MKLGKALFVLALAALIASPAYAETQNVKVSGSIDAYWFYRENFDLRDNNDVGVVPAGSAAALYDHGAAGSIAEKSEADSFFMSVTQVQVAADLTDNVSTVINIANQRDWNADTFDGVGGTGNDAAEYDIDLDLAYVQMKEIFYSPLTLTVGRQDLLFGRGFIIGWNPIDPNASIQADEYTALQAFDAVRATLDFQPWTIDVVYSKILENDPNPEDDIDLWIANVNYKFAEYNAVAEGYYVGHLDRSLLSGVAATGSTTNDTHTLGGRVQFDPISQITLGGELAYQLGSYRAAVADPERDRSAWGVDIFGTYRWDNVWKPELTLEYVSLSGEGNMTATTEDYGAWNSLYRGKFWTAYADFREFVYGTSDAADQPASTNQNLIQVKGSLKPMEDLLLEGAFTYLWTDEDIAGRSDEIGYEIDLQAVYDYTEDVSFGVLLGWFVPGDFYSSPNDETALDLVSSVKVTF
ncbi:MAG: hypothetical protein A3D28_01895 [Omnitrophica bacterium RIFCSPHIGHO2_02_FULL_63_14]|nr:MAG: hypothetical protein A3D28_01895 [Omnitrophica bacterium RIFCSPHIGHO2_02_FULL_63_14]